MKEDHVEPSIAHHQQLDPIGSGIISTILYFDIFHYPLTLQEIKFNCHQVLASEEAIERALNELVNKGMLIEKDGYYLLSPNDSIIQKRIAGNQLSKKFFRKANRYSRLIASFPFVRCVCLSGSLSKGYMEKDSDVDYFIITKPGRLWVSRTFLVLFKKIFLLNSKKYFCVNYFIDENNLTIPDKNIFTATELSFLIPTYNFKLYNQLIMENNWCRDLYPNKKITRDAENIAFKNGLVKRSVEWILNGRLGERLDTIFFSRTIKYWKKKFVEFDDSSFDLNLRSRKNVSKHHPRGFQYKVLKELEEKKARFESTHHVALTA